MTAPWLDDRVYERPIVKIEPGVLTKLRIALYFELGKDLLERERSIRFDDVLVAQLETGVVACGWECGLAVPAMVEEPPHIVQRDADSGKLKGLASVLSIKLLKAELVNRQNPLLHKGVLGALVNREGGIPLAKLKAV